jgi:hypothetical protein
VPNVFLSNADLLFNDYTERRQGRQCKFHYTRSLTDHEIAEIAGRPFTKRRAKKCGFLPEDDLQSRPG